jgi:hypothetical protein
MNASVVLTWVLSPYSLVERADETCGCRIETGRVERVTRVIGTRHL